MRRILVAAALAFSLCTVPAVAEPELTEEQREQRFDLGIEFTQCAGFNWAVSELAPALGKSEAEMRQAKEAGNGAWVAALYLFWSTMNDFQRAKDLASDQSDMQRNTWVASLSGGGSDGTWANALSLIERCLEIGPIQTELVEQFRKDMHLRGRIRSACGAGPMITLPLALAAALWTAPAAAQQQERGCQPAYRLYRTSVAVPGRLDVAIFDTCERAGEDQSLYNADMCEHTRRLFQAQPGVQVSF